MLAPTTTVPAPAGSWTSGGDPPVVVVVGDVMLDVVARPAGALVAGGDTPAAITMRIGGSAANVAAAAAAAGAESHVVAAVGDDISGRAASVALARAGVVAHLWPSRRPTGSVVALVDASGQRSMLSDRGANVDLAPDALPVGLLAPGRHLHLSGYVLRDEATRPAGRAILAAARAAGMSRSVDPSAGFPATDEATRPAGRGILPAAGAAAMSRSVDPSAGFPATDEATRPAGRGILPAAGAAGMSRSVDPSDRSPLRADARAWLSWAAGVEWCCANLAEGRALTGVADPEGVALALAGHFKEVAVTLGAGGVMVAGGGGPPMRFGALGATVVDTTGAGDAFTGTWLVRRLAGDDVASAAGAALAAAAAAVSSVGAGWDRHSAT